MPVFSLVKPRAASISSIDRFSFVWTIIGTGGEPSLCMKFLIKILFQHSRLGFGSPLLCGLRLNGDGMQ
jgi:hypothetical protein